MLAGPGTQLRESLMRYMATAMPGPASQVIAQNLQQTSQASSGWKVLLGIVLAPGLRPPEWRRCKTL